MKILQCGTLLLLASSFVHAGNKAGVEAANAKSLSLVGKPAPNFTLPDFDHKAFEFSERRGQVVVLAFWATWCPPCRSEMPALAKLQKELAPEGVSIVPVAFDNPGKAQEFLTKKHIDIWSLMDERGEVASIYGAHVLPKTFLVNRAGVVAKVMTGKLPESELRKALANMQ